LLLINSRTAFFWFVFGMMGERVLLLNMMGITGPRLDFLSVSFGFSGGWLCLQFEERLSSCAGVVVTR
jgi:hypothetical protein